MSKQDKNGEDRNSNHLDLADCVESPIPVEPGKIYFKKNLNCIKTKIINLQQGQSRINSKLDSILDACQRLNGNLDK